MLLIISHFSNDEIINPSNWPELFCSQFSKKNSLHSRATEIILVENEDEGAISQGECPVDIQVTEPQSGWDAQKPSKWWSYCFVVT